MRPETRFEFGGNYTATQNMAEWFMENEPDWMTALWVADEDFNDPSSPDYGQGLNSASCFPACPSTGPFTFFNRQYDSLGAMSSMARSQYNALQLSFGSAGATATSSTSTTPWPMPWTTVHRSERGSFFGQRFDNGGYTGFLINTWNLDQQYADADFDIRHQINVNWVAELAVRSRQADRQGRQRLRQRVHRRLVGGGLVAMDQRLPVQRRRTAGRAGPRTGTCRATPRS